MTGQDDNSETDVASQGLLLLRRKQSDDVKRRLKKLGERAASAKNRPPFTLP